MFFKDLAHVSPPSAEVYPTSVHIYPPSTHLYPPSANVYPPSAYVYPPQLIPLIAVQYLLSNCSSMGRVILVLMYCRSVKITGFPESIQVLSCL